MNQDNQQKRRRPLVTNIAWSTTLLVVLLFAYVLSYAPAANLFGTTQVISSNGRYHILYAPVDWLIYNTPLATPLLRWAELWGVQDAFESAWLERIDAVLLKELD